MVVLLVVPDASCFPYRDVPQSLVGALAVQRAVVSELLSSLGLSTARANAMTGPQFVTLFRGLQAAGCALPSERTAVESDGSDYDGVDEESVEPQSGDEASAASHHPEVQGQPR